MVWLCGVGWGVSSPCRRFLLFALFVFLFLLLIVLVMYGLVMFLSFFSLAFIFSFFSSRACFDLFSSESAPEMSVAQFSRFGSFVEGIVVLGAFPSSFSSFLSVPLSFSFLCFLLSFSFPSLHAKAIPLST